LSSTGGIWGVAAVTVFVVDAASRRLLRIQAEFRITLTALGIASQQKHD